jgi:3-methylfumaryl-CoA hydratase
VSTPPDPTDPRRWVGRERVEEDLLDPFPARGMAALLDREPGRFSEGAPLPAGWHWLHFKPLVRRGELGEDGHERLGSFLPPVPRSRRMWAGGTLAFHGELRLGERALRRSTVEAVERKEGRSGSLVFVTVRHRITTARGLAVDEAQHLVYRPAAAALVRPGPEAPTAPAWSEPFLADAVALFRFSALTFNGHRIHYDAPYATQVEGFPGLVVHGPLLALLLLDGASRHGSSGYQSPGDGPPGEASAGHRIPRRGPRAPDRFAYRAVGPLFEGEAFRIEGTAPRASDSPGQEARLWVAGPRGLAMEATAAWKVGP